MVKPIERPRASLRLHRAQQLCLIATYHPTEFRDFQKEDGAFFARLARAKELVNDISVNFVIYEKNLPFAESLKTRLDKLGVHLTVNPQNNTANGYGQPIKPLTDREREIARSLADNEFIDYFYIQNKRADVRCTAGRDMIDISHTGDVTRCEHIAAQTSAAERMGNILDGTAVIDTVSRFCPLGGCACKSTLGYIEDCVKKFKRVGTQHKYHRRREGEVGVRSYDAVPMVRAKQFART